MFAELKFLHSSRQTHSPESASTGYSRTNQVSSSLKEPKLHELFDLIIFKALLDESLIGKIVCYYLCQ